MSGTLPTRLMRSPIYRERPLCDVKVAMITFDIDVAGEWSTPGTIEDIHIAEEDLAIWIGTLD